MKKKMKIWIYVAAAIAVIVLVAVFFWIGGNRKDTVGIFYRDSSQENALFRDALEQALEAKGLTVIVSSADGDQAKQNQQIRQLKKQSCDVLLIEPVMTDAGQELLSTVENTGLPAVLINRQLEQTLLAQYPQVSFIGAEEEKAGELQAQLMLGLPDNGDLNGDGTVAYMLLQGPEDHKNTRLRTQSFQQALTSSGTSVQQLSLCSGDWTLESGRKLVRQELASYGKDIEVIVCGNDQMALGAAQAIADGGRTVGKDIYLLAIGGEEDTLKMIAAGTLSGTVYSDPAVQINAITEAIAAKINQQPVQSWRLLPYTIVTVENINYFLKK